MANQYLDMKTLRFLLYQVHDFDKIVSMPYYADHDKSTIDMFLDSMKDFGDKELFPYLKEMDEQPAHYHDGKIIVHPQIEKTLRKAGELGILRAPLPYEKEGMQMPQVAYQVGSFVLDAANNHVPGYWGLTLGSANLVIAFGNEELNKKYVPKMLDAEWGGTMCLTEPQAGSSLSDVSTSAMPQEDGSYKIKGQKIFISGGDHEYVENVVHLVLARIDGAPRGTKGISLFVVPKKRILEDGGLEANDVLTGGDFQKMGQRSYCTTHIVFGEHDNCQGWLVGEAHQGLRYMFKMMNEARISVGRGAAAIATAAYYASLEYARERPQGRRIQNSGKKNANEEQTLIINHPDVRRMLLLQKAISEASISLCIQAGYYHDMSVASEDEEERKKYHTLLEIITPIVKTYPSEAGQTSVSNGLQILGGYGFCSEYILQQYYRDIRISALYEGTTGIQSIDLLGRKMMMNNGAGAMLLAAEVMESIQAAMTYDDLKPYAKILGDKLAEVQKVMAHLGGFAAEGNFERFLSDATIFMDFMSTIVVGWQWIKMATNAKQALVTGDNTHTAEFYDSKIHCMKFYFKYEMTKTTGLIDTIMSDDVLTILDGQEVFS